MTERPAPLTDPEHSELPDVPGPRPAADGGDRESGLQANLKALGAAATGAGVAALASAATVCCVPVLAPLVVGLLGAGGAVWAAGLEPYGPYLLGGSFLLLGYGFRTSYRRSPGGDGFRRRRQRAVRVVLWIAAGLWLTSLGINVLVRIAPPR